MPPDREPRAAKARPDPNPMRFAFGVSGLIAATALATAIAQPAPPAPTSVALDTAVDPAPTATPAPLVVRHVTRYVQLQPGQTAPPGASVVARPDPSPRVVVVTVPAPAPPAAVRRVVVVTRQSGTK
jgi:hypothetical protein